MKLYFVSALILCVNSLGFGQESTLRSTFEDIQYVKDIKVYDDEIYCAGYSFKTAINDGNSSYAYLVNYEKKTLKPKWSLKISDKHSNEINAILRVKDKIYALVTQGKDLPLSREVYLNLFIINLNGEIEETVHFGRSFFPPSNIIINGSHLYFGYQVGTNVTYANNDLKPFVLKYNLETKKITRFKSNQYQSRPNKLLFNNGNLYLSGIYLLPNQANVLSCKNGLFPEFSINPTKTEYFLDSYIKDKVLTILCVFPGVYGNTKTYLRYYHINLATKKISIKTIPYTELGWSDVKFDTYSAGSSTWLIVKDISSKHWKYVLLDNHGNINKTLTPGYGDNNYSGNFIIAENTLISANSSGIRVITF